MGIFKTTKREPKSQVAMLKEALERGEVLDQMNMLYDYGVGNHTGRIHDVRKRFEDEGKGYFYVMTRFVNIKARKSGKTIRVARYFIPDCLDERKKKAMNV